MMVQWVCIIHHYSISFMLFPVTEFLSIIVLVGYVYINVSLEPAPEMNKDGQIPYMMFVQTQGRIWSVYNYYANENYVVYTR